MFGMQREMSQQDRIEPRVDWFGPMAPLTPVAPPEVKGRQFDYPFGFNLRLRPREQEAGVSFEQLRGFADSYDLLRSIIENRKDLVCSMSWSFKMTDDDKKPDDRCAQLKTFFAQPMPDVLFQDWLRMILEDMYVIDAVAVYPRKNQGGGLYALELIDGATINRLLDAGGRMPLPPDPAYQQILKGLPAIDYTSDELIYRVRNPRTWKVYGFSKVEQILVTVNIALRRQAFTLQYYTEGSLPEAMYTVPEDWTPDNIKTFQIYFDELMSGDGAQRRKMRLMPNGKFQEIKQPPLKDQFDEWLARVCCYAFGVSPSAFTAQVNRATAESAKEQAQEEGISPVLQYIESIIDGIILKVFGWDDIIFRFDNSKELDPKTASEIDDRNVKNGRTTINELRVKDGNEPTEGGDLPFIVIGSTVVLVKDLAKMSEKAASPSPPPMLPGDTKPVGANETPVAPNNAPPVAKARKIKPINRDRASIVALRTRCADSVARLLGDVGKAVASQVAAAVGKLAKSDVSDDEIDAILANVDLNGLDALEAFMLEYIKSAADDGMAAASIQINATPAPDALALANDRAVKYATDRSAELVTMITDTTRDSLRSAIADSLEAGESTNQLAARLQDSYAFSDERAQVIARTEMARADIQGSLEGYRASGVVDGKQWVTANDDLVSDDCNECAAEGVIALESNFTTGVQGPPNHPNCRCDVIPIVA
jgi:SPP1 gp7 family putative phage head morphogenesis protein